MWLSGWRYRHGARKSAAPGNGGVSGSSSWRNIGAVSAARLQQRNARPQLMAAALAAYLAAYKHAASAAARRQPQRHRVIAPRAVRAAHASGGSQRSRCVWPLRRSGASSRGMASAAASRRNKRGAYGGIRAWRRAAGKSTRWHAHGGENSGVAAIAAARRQRCEMAAAQRAANRGGKA